jgi:hypothetical protein
MALEDAGAQVFAGYEYGEYSTNGFERREGKARLGYFQAD